MSSYHAAIVSFMALIVQLRTMNHPFLPDLLVTRELVPLFNVESFTRSLSKLTQPIL